MLEPASSTVALTPWRLLTLPRRTHTCMISIARLTICSSPVLGDRHGARSRYPAHQAEDRASGTARCQILGWHLLGRELPACSAVASIRTHMIPTGHLLTLLFSPRCLPRLSYQNLALVNAPETSKDPARSPLPRAPRPVPTSKDNRSYPRQIAPATWSVTLTQRTHWHSNASLDPDASWLGFAFSHTPGRYTVAHAGLE